MTRERGRERKKEIFYAAKERSVLVINDVSIKCVCVCCFAKAKGRENMF